jgi:prolyl 4-hydroxylase
MENFIRIYKTDKKLCDDLIKYHKSNVEYKAVGETGHGVNKDYKDSIDVRFYNQSKDKTILKFFNVLSVSVVKYLTEFKIQFPVNTDNTNLIQWYPKGGGFKVFHSESQSLESSHRRLVYMLYLNNVPDGGTEFKYQEITTEAIKGDLLIWPAEFTHLHKSVISKTKEKYIATGWFQMDNRVVKNYA